MSLLMGKTAFVSGGTRGIGLAIAKRLASEGADIMVAGSSEANCLAATTVKQHLAAADCQPPSRKRGLPWRAAVGHGGGHPSDLTFFG